MNLSPEYLAGFFDGEGSIVIGKRKLKTGAPWYVLVVCLTNTHLPLLTAVHEVFETGKKKVYGNHGFTLRPKIHGQRQCYNLNIASDIAENFLRYVRPHLIVKADEADLAFEFRDHVRRYRHEHRRFVNDRSKWYDSDLYKKIQSERHAMYLRMRELKRPDFSGYDGMIANSEKAPCPATNGGAEG